jgi:hypothetical protein
MSTGPTFITVGDQQNATWKLGDIKVTGFEAGSDFVQMLSPTDAGVILSATYIDEAMADILGDPSMVGWWNDSIDTSLNDQVFTAGTGFLTYLTSSDVTITYAGEVLQGPTTIDLSGMSFSMVANFTPVDLTLGDISASGFEAGSDFIQMLSPADASIVLSATYIDEAMADTLGDPSMVGWWNDSIDASLDNQVFTAGAAFLGYFSSPNVTFFFPNPLSI